MLIRDIRHIWIFSKIPVLQERTLASIPNRNDVTSTISLWFLSSHHTILKVVLWVSVQQTTELLFGEILDLNFSTTYYLVIAFGWHKYFAYPVAYFSSSETHSTRSKCFTHKRRVIGLCLNTDHVRMLGRYSHYLTVM